MKKNAILESIREATPDFIKRETDLSFYIVDRVAEILQSKGMTQRDLADLLGKNESEVSKWMTGTHNFTMRTIAKIENALKVPIFDLDKDQYADKKFLKAETNEYTVVFINDEPHNKRLSTSFAYDLNPPHKYISLN